jgi:hypothetical protein
MKRPNSNAQNQDERGGVRLKRFLVRHIEKIAAAAMILTAIVLALQARNYPSLTWQPDELIIPAESVEETIKNNPPGFEHHNISIFDFARLAERIKEWIPSEPYRHETVWFPILVPDRPLLGKVEILTAESLRGEAVRRSGLNTPIKLPDQWKPPPPTQTLYFTPTKTSAEWVNIYGTFPVKKQSDKYNQVFDLIIETQTPEYIYYELEKAEIKPKEELEWLPVIVYPGYSVETFCDVSSERLIPLGQQKTLHERDLLLFSDFEVESAKTYAYRIRLHLINPNYHVQEHTVESGVNTSSPLLCSDWSLLATVAVPDRLVVRLLSVTPTDSAVFPRQTTPLRQVKGTISLDYFDVEMGLSLPPVDKVDVLRGMMCNISKKEAIESLGNTIVADVPPPNYPDVGLRSDVCVLDFGGGRRLPKHSSRDAQTSPDLFVPGKALLLLPDGSMQTITTAPDLPR